jgi:hypothetical protein
MRAYGITNAAPYASAPAVGAAGDSYWNTTSKILYVSDGTAWVAVGPGGPPTGAAGGSLKSTYPNPGIAALAVGTPELADGAVTRAKVAVGASYNIQGDFLPVSFSSATINADVSVKTLPALTTRGGRVRVEINPGGYLTVTAAGAFFRFVVYRNTVSTYAVRWSCLTPGGTGWLPLPSLLFWDSPAAGTWTYEFRVFQNVANLVNLSPDSAGTFYVVEAA